MHLSNHDTAWAIACAFSFLFGVIVGIRSGRVKK
jgi:hypothetical protein